MRNSRNVQPKDRRRQNAFSYLPFLLLVIFGQVIRVTLLIRQRSSTSFAAVDPTNLITVLLLGMGLALLLTPRGGLVLRKYLSSPLKLFLLYFGFCALSSLWSDSTKPQPMRPHRMELKLDLF